jgi:leucyl aminopeptidase
MIKFILLFSLFFLHILTLEEISTTTIRLLEFNETHREYLPFSYVLKHISECGKSGQHGGFMDVTDHPHLNANQQIHEKVSFPPNPKHQTLVNDLMQYIDKNNIATFNNMLTKRPTRYYTSESGRDAAHEIRDTFLQYAEGRNDISASLFPHTWLQPSVIARIEGHGPNKDQVVVIGAHEDSISNRPDAPGADDDASGVSVLLETYRILAQKNFIPSRSIEFHTYSAEEVGMTDIR